MINFAQINNLAINAMPNDARIVFAIIYNDMNNKCIKNDDVFFTVQFSEDIDNLLPSNFKNNTGRFTIDSVTKNTNFIPTSEFLSEYTINISNVIEELNYYFDLFIDYTGTVVNLNNVYDIIYHKSVKINTVTPNIVTGTINHIISTVGWKVVLTSDNPILVDKSRIIFHKTSDDSVISSITLSDPDEITLGITHSNILTYHITGELVENIYFKIDNYYLFSDIYNRGFHIPVTEYFISPSIDFDSLFSGCSITFNKDFVKPNDTLLVTVDFLEPIVGFYKGSLIYNTGKFSIPTYTMTEPNQTWVYTFTVKSFATTSLVDFSVNMALLHDNFDNYGVGIESSSINIIAGNYPNITITIPSTYTTGPSPLIDSLVNCSLVVNDALPISNLSIFNLSTSTHYSVSNFAQDGDNKHYLFDLTPIGRNSINNQTVTYDNTTISIGGNTGGGVSTSNLFDIFIKPIPTAVNIEFSNYIKLTNTVSVVFTFNTPITIPTIGNGSNYTITTKNIDGTLTPLTSSDGGLTWDTDITFNSTNSLNNYFTVDNFTLVGVNGVNGSDETDLTKHYYISSKYSISNGYPEATITVDDLAIAIYNIPLKFYITFSTLLDLPFGVKDLSFPNELGILQNFTEVTPGILYTVEFVSKINSTYLNNILSVPHSINKAYKDFAIIKSKFDSVIVYRSHDFKDQTLFSSFTASNYVNTESQEKFIIRTPIPIVGYSSKYDTVILNGLNVEFLEITESPKTSHFRVNSGTFLFNKDPIKILETTNDILTNQYLYNVLVFYFDTNTQDIAHSFESILDAYSLNKKIISMFQYDGVSYRPMIDIKTVNLDMLVKFNNQVLTLSYNSPTNSNSQIAYGTK